MPKKRILQAGKSKEVYRASEDSTNGNVPPVSLERAYTTEDTEFHRYSEILRGFFEMLARWQAIAKEEKFIYSQYPLNYDPAANIISEAWESQFEVRQTAQGRVIGTVSNEPDGNKKSTRVLHAQVSYDQSPPHGSRPDGKGTYGDTTLMMIFKPGLAGEQLVVDPEGKPLEEVRIDLASIWAGDWKEFSIYAIYSVKWNRPKKSKNPCAMYAIRLKIVLSKLGHVL